MIRRRYIRLIMVGSLFTIFCFIVHLQSIIHESKKYEDFSEHSEHAITIWSNDFHIRY
jgi:hypothetical protein